MRLDRFQLYIDGAFIDGQASFDSLDPSTGEPWATMPAASGYEVERAVEAASRAFRSPEWANLSATQRGRLLIRLGDLVETHADTLARIETQDTGKIIRETSAQIKYVAEFYRYFGGMADKLEGKHLPIDKNDMEVFYRREPLGVVAAIVSWNSSLFLSAMKLGPALAAGCTIVIKASEDGPAALLWFAHLIEEAGFPKGVVNIITGFGEPAGRALTSHPKVARIAFTGGPETARHIVRNSAANLAHLTLELGGKSPILVFRDADVPSVANAVVAGIFAASGQSCVAGSRLYVQRPIYDELVSLLVERAGGIKVGDPQDVQTEMGPLATSRQRQRIEQIIARSLEAGATILCGGSAPPTPSKGWYFQPTIISVGNNNAPCVVEELFGPVLSVLAFDTEGEAIALANDTRFGLASGVFTRSLTCAHRVARQLRSGIVWINTYRAVSPIAPFGGYGLSGSGREGGSEAMLEYTRPKTVWIHTSDEPIDDPFVMR